MALSVPYTTPLNTVSVVLGLCINAWRIVRKHHSQQERYHSTKLPLKTWFRAIYHLTQTKEDISNLELARRLGVTQNTAWKISNKMMQVMHEREAVKHLTGRVEMDDAYIGGKRVGKRGRGSAGKVPFVAAVETTDDGKPHRMKLHLISGFTSSAIGAASGSFLSGETLLSQMDLAVLQR